MSKSFVFWGDPKMTTMNDSKAKLLFFTLALCMSALSPAQDTRFGQTYTWLTEAKGEHEIEIKMCRLDKDTWLSENEFEIGVTDRFTVAPYLNLLDAKGSSKLGGGAIEMRYRFGELKSKKLLPALYLEPQQINGDPAMTVESRLIGTYYPSDKFDSLLSGNLIVTRLMAKNEALAYGYAIGAVKMRAQNWCGAEAYGSWTDQSHFIGPTAGFKLKDTTSVILNYGFSLNKQDNQLKVILAHGF